MSDELPSNLRPIADFFGLPGTAAVAKDFHVVRAIRALAAVDAAPFILIFGGGTALARAHRLVRRMSEDVDFKIVPTPAAPVSRSALHRQRSALRARVTVALQAAGFAFDPKDPAQTRSRDESSYTIWQLPYETDGAGQGLRPTIQVELNYAPMRQPPVTLPVASFVAEAMSLPPEVPAIACVGVIETAAEKLVSLALVQTPILSAMWNDIVQRIQMAANLQIRIEARFAPEPVQGRGVGQNWPALLGQNSIALPGRNPCPPKRGKVIEYRRRRLSRKKTTSRTPFSSQPVPEAGACHAPDDRSEDHRQREAALRPDRWRFRLDNLRLDNEFIGCLIGHWRSSPASGRGTAPPEPAAPGRRRWQ